MNNFVLSGRVVSFKTKELRTDLKVINILLRDDDEQKKPVFKIALWNQDAETAKDIQLGDMITVEGKIFGYYSDRWTDWNFYCDIRVTKLVSISRITHKREYVYDSASNATESQTTSMAGPAPTQEGGAK